MNVTTIFPNNRSMIAHEAVNRVLSKIIPDWIDTKIERQYSTVDIIALDSIKYAEMLIMDISDRELDIYYQLGYAHALMKNTIMIKNLKSDVEIPVDIEGYVILIYDEENTTKFEINLSNAINKYISNMGRIQQ
ncbi:hypothetical protein KQI52_04060 [bacterium]|nr:hypothetical protein [bacterium]